MWLQLISALKSEVTLKNTCKVLNTDDEAFLCAGMVCTFGLHMYEYSCLEGTDLHPFISPVN